LSHPLLDLLTLRPGAALLLSPSITRRATARGSPPASALLDRLTHHADITLIEGQSFRVRESELESAARGKKSSEKNK
jgi:hypothetical protein